MNGEQFDKLAFHRKIKYFSLVRLCFKKSIGYTFLFQVNQMPKF
jgi:hypothetical protein